MHPLPPKFLGQLYQLKHHCLVPPLSDYCCHIPAFEVSEYASWTDMEVDDRMQQHPSLHARHVQQHSGEETAC